MAPAQIDNHPEIANIQQFFYPRDLPMPKDAQSTFEDFVRSLRGRRISYASLFQNSLRVCVDRRLNEKTGFFLCFEPVWHLGSLRGILVGSRQAQSEERDARAALNLLVEEILDKQIESIRIEPISNDVDVQLSGGYRIRTFVSDPTDDQTWYFRDCQTNLVVSGSPKGLRLEERSAANPNDSPLTGGAERQKQKLERKAKLKPGQVVILMALPPGFIDDLPEEEQQAISARIGRPILLLKYEQGGMAVLEFMDKDDGIHTLYVDPKFIRKW